MFIIYERDGIMNRILCFSLIIIFIGIENLHSQWVQSDSLFGSSVTSLTTAVDNNNNEYLVAGTYGEGILLSTDGGGSWNESNNGLTNQSGTALYVTAVASSGLNVAIGTLGGIFLSADGAKSWSIVTDSSTQTGINTMAFGSGNNIFAGTQGNGIFVSNNGGATWTQNDLNTPFIYSMTSLSLSDTSAYICSGSYGDVSLSVNEGKDWSQLNNGLPQSKISALVALISMKTASISIFAGMADSGIFLSTNNGVDWKESDNNISSLPIGSFAVTSHDSAQAKIFAGTLGGGVFVSTNYGANWSPVNDGLNIGSQYVYGLAISGPNLIAGTANGLWKRPLTQMITSVRTLPGTVPYKFNLTQNYPNPFNPTTVISYQLSTLSHVELEVYNVLGEKVAELVNKEQTAGAYKVTFNASNLATGIYFYELQAGNYTSVKKMILLK